MGKFEISIILLFLLIVSSLIGFAVYYNESQGARCLEDPLGYFLEDQNESGINCFCSMESGLFTFNRSR